MKKFNDEIYLTIGEVSKIIKRGTQTIKNWYAWQEQEGQSELPPVYTDLDAKGTRYFKESDISQLEHFRDNITYGMMADYNREKWGIRGQELKKKES